MQKGSETPGGILLHRRQGMRVGVERHLDPLMPEALLDDVRRHASFQQERRRRVAESMESDPPHYSGFRPGFSNWRTNVTVALSHVKNRYQGDARYRQMIATRSPSTYRVYVGRNAFEGRIDGYPGEGTLYQHWLEEGTLPCPEPQPPLP